jgi:hypothetical protein
MKKRFLDQTKQANVQWLHDPNLSNVYNIHNVRHEASSHFRNIKKEYLKVKIDEIEISNTIKNNRDLYRSINGFKKVCQPRTNIVKGGKGDLVTDSHSILARWRNHFCQLLNIHGVDYFRQAEIHAAQPLVPVPNALMLRWFL